MLEDVAANDNLEISRDVTDTTNGDTIEVLTNPIDVACGDILRMQLEMSPQALTV